MPLAEPGGFNDSPVRGVVAAGGTRRQPPSPRSRLAGQVGRPEQAVGQRIEQAAAPGNEDNDELGRPQSSGSPSSSLKVRCRWGWVLQSETGRDGMGWDGLVRGEGGGGIE